MTKPTLYLASSSPRRKALLEQLMISFSVLQIEVEERKQPNEKATDYVCRLSREKAIAGVAVAPTLLPVLGADTVVVCDGLVMEKPQNQQDAHRMLSLLSGREHQVLTALTVADHSHVITKLVTTTVNFTSLSDEEIEKYWQTEEPIGKAGGYAIQGLGGRFVTRIEGSYHAVVGLPLYETDALLTEFESLRGKKP